jgi:C-terminal processing protease CtpA/Prc
MVTNAAVIPNAAAADLKAHDQIVSLDGNDAGTAELSQLRETFKGKPGIVVHLTVKTTDGKISHVV